MYVGQYCVTLKWYCGVGQNGFHDREMGKAVKRPSRKSVIATMRRLCRDSIRPETDSKYGSSIKRMRKFLSERGLRKMGVREFEEFLADLVAKKRAGSTAAGYRAAWLFWRETRGKKPPSGRKMRRVNRAIAGMRYKGGKPLSMPRGAIDSGQLMQLRYHCVVNGFTEEADGFALMWYGMLRHFQGHEVRACDLRNEAVNGPMVHLPLKKAFSAGRCVPGNMGHFKDVGNLKSLLRHLKAGKHGADLIFPNWCEARARDLIKEAAIVFGWDPLVKWDGVHCFRHGATQEAAASLKIFEDPVRSVMRRATWASVGSVRGYKKKRGGKK